MYILEASLDIKRFEAGDKPQPILALIYILCRLSVVLSSVDLLVHVTSVQLSVAICQQVIRQYAYRNYSNSTYDPI